MYILLLLLLSVVLIIALTARFNVHPFLALLFAALFYGLSSGMTFDMLVQSINNGFAKPWGK